MGSGFSKMKKQARMLEQQFEQMKQEMQNKQFTGSSGNGLVTVTINGEKELQGIKIKPECIDKDDLEGLEDLIKAALKEAYESAQNDQSSSGFSMPGGLPFSF